MIENQGFVQNVQIVCELSLYRHRKTLHQFCTICTANTELQTNDLHKAPGNPSESFIVL